MSATVFRLPCNDGDDGNAVFLLYAREQAERHVRRTMREWPHGARLAHRFVTGMQMRVGFMGYPTPMLSTVAIEFFFTTARQQDEVTA